MQGMLIPDKYLCHSPLMIACEEDKKNIVELLLNNGASAALKNKVDIAVTSMHHSYCILSNHSYSFDLLFQNGLTAVHIACKNGRRVILSCLLEEAKTQKRFCFKRKLSSDYDVVMSAKAREVRTCCMLCNCPHDCKLTSKVHY